jgi:hypothetical protein
MTHGAPSAAPQSPYRDDPSEDIQARVVGTTNESPSSAIPIPQPAEVTPTWRGVTTWQQRWSTMDQARREADGEVLLH